MKFLCPLLQQLIGSSFVDKVLFCVVCGCEATFNRREKQSQNVYLASIITFRRVPSENMPKDTMLLTLGCGKFRLINQVSRKTAVGCMGRASKLWDRDGRCMAAWLLVAMSVTDG